MTPVVTAIALAAFALVADGITTRAAEISLGPGISHRLDRHADRAHGFSFWYPQAIKITAASSHDDTRFPGGTVVETLQVGSPGGVSVYVVTSPASTITDEPNGHAAPIAQTRYFYDATSQRWMVSYPEGTDGGGPAATAPADVSQKTVGGLPMLPSGARFDTTIIPLSTTLFVVVQDGGGSAFTNQLARTVAPLDAHVDVAARKTALRDLARAYEKQLQQTISPATLCALGSAPCAR